MNWRIENGVDLAEEISGLCQKLQEVEVLLEPGFIERVSKQGEAFFDAFNTHEKLEKHLSEVNAALTRAEELMPILRSQWIENNSLILRLLPFPGTVRMRLLEQRVSDLVECRMELTHLLQIWTADNLHSRKASMLFTSRDYRRALAEEEEISIRRWQDIESSRVGGWVTQKAAEFAKTHLIDGHTNLNHRIASDLRFRQEFEKLPGVVSDKVWGHAKRASVGTYLLENWTGSVGAVLLLIGVAAMISVIDSRTKKCLWCGRSHPHPPITSLLRVNSVAKSPAAMVTVMGGTLHLGREIHFHALPVVEKEPGRTPDPQILGTFKIGKYEVTYGEWKKVREYAADNGYNDLKRAGDGSRGSNCPVTHVTWYDVVKWCNAKSEMEGRMPVYEVDGATFKKGTGRNGSTIVTQRLGANGYRLPTGAEWEWAAGGGQFGRHEYYSGSSDASEVAWYGNNTFGPQFVGNKKANELGLHDMTGNVWEWCWDPEGKDSKRRQVRGGSYRTPQTCLEISHRHFQEPDRPFDDVGFRLVRGPE